MSKIRYKMPGIGFLLILLALVTMSSIECLKLSKGDDRVKFEDKTNGFYTLTLDENLNDTVVLFKIEDVIGKINVDYSSTCTDIMMYGTITDKYEFKLTKALDYEKPGCPDTQHVINDKQGSEPVTFEIKLNNLDDNPPQFQLNSHCQLHENTVYTKENASCSLTMTDLDGMMENTELTILDSENSQLFMVHFQNVPKTEDTTATVVIYLQVGKTLDYETKNSYVFVVNAKEEIQTGQVQVVIDVIDEPDQPPKFTKMFTTQQFEENIDQTFYVLAQDGDIGINSPISYAITKDGCEENKYSCRITISKDGGEINVENVDREETGDTIKLTIEAIEADDNSATPLDITFFIIDQDDNVPKITLDSSAIRIDEGTRGTILKFSVEDMDLSDNGTYSIELDNGKSSVDYVKAFEVIPDSGYHSADFTLTVTNSTALDYEDKDWKVINFNILAIEKADASHTTSQAFTINLNDINDEPPIFVDTSDSVDISEDIRADSIVFNATAVDRDEGDVITYEIVGVWKEKLDIDNQGIIRTKLDNTFDYELLKQVIIAIKASDKDAVHQTTKTLTINVLDVDDEPPVMRINITSEDKMVKIKENSELGTVLENVTILVTDPDTKPKLKVEIDWKSSYVTKNSGIKTLADDLWQCFEVDTNLEEAQSISRTISVNGKCSPDFEQFDALALFLKAVDENTVLGNNFTTGSFLINIVDVNDNIPQFIDSSLKDLIVTDGTNEVTKIGIISAKDDDIGDELSFSIKPADNEPDWVDIDEKSGKLTVKKGVVIDCDEPKRDDISYYVTVHDPDPTHNNTTKVSIHIVDFNDEVPLIHGKTTEVQILENATDDLLVSHMLYTDLDRDSPYNAVVFKFEANLTNDASNRFGISETGDIAVKLRNGAFLDRDAGPDNYVLPILAYDNPNGTLQLKDHFDLKVILLDVDDNIPILDNKDLTCTENLKKAETLADIIAIDPDEDGPNSDVYFLLKNIIPTGDHSNDELNGNFFEITKSETDIRKATIKLLKSLKGVWGEYNMTIRTTDDGNKDPKAYNDNIIQLTVERFNFDQPVFDFPKTDAEKSIIVNRDRTKPKSDIILYNGEKLENLKVNDQQDHKWDVAFEITEEDGGQADLFRIIQVTRWEGSLQIQRTLSEEEMNGDHTIKIKAKVKNDMKEGEAAVSVETTMTVKFFSLSEQPKFKDNEAEVKIKENNMTQVAIPQNATFSIEGMTPYYFLANPSDIFKILPENGTITLLEPLDYETKTEHNIKIVAWNEKIPPSDPPQKGSNVLDLKVSVIDMNDNAPVFTPSKFTGAFLRNYNKGTPILTVKAIDADPTLQELKFSLENFDCSNSLKAPKIPFDISPTEGVITNDFTVTSDMSGYCDFNVVVVDQADTDGTTHTVTTTVQINIISDNELVKFTFFNKDSYINQYLDNITSIINDAFKDYNYRSFLADLVYDDSSKNTTAHFYFIDSNDQPVAAEEILGNLTDPNTYANLTKAMAAIQVQLYYFSYDNVDKVVDDYLKIWLIVTIFILAALLTMITIVFFFRNRALTRRINNLSTTKFGSQESGLNRAGVTAPTTNKNAVEGSNPVFNSESFIKEMEDDSKSVLSGDSDLLGVENNPDFDF